MIALSLAELSTLAGGTLAQGDPAAVVLGPVVTDSRRVLPGSVFVAIKGERVDGHDFAERAVADGAVAVLAERVVGSVPTVLVDHVVAGLGRLAHGFLGRLPSTTVIALTGSSGKTSTKDLVAGLLETVGPTVSAPGSYNTEIGLPLTVLEASTDTAFLVLEMGARGLGHISKLTRIARPAVGVVLNVGSAHLGEFGSRELIAVAKAELVAAVPAGGLVVLNADDPLVAAMRGQTSARVITFGTSSPADVRADGVELVGGRARFRLVGADGSAAVQLQLFGEHQVANALAAAAVALSAGLSVEAVAAGLGAALPRSRWRMEVTERPDAVTVVNDAYNANPESMRAALRTLVDLAAGRRTWAVLGEMRELGPAAAIEHDAVGRLAVSLGVNRLVVVGEGARGIHLGAGLAAGGRTQSMLVADTDAVVALLAAEVTPGDVVLLKASRAAGLEQVAEALLAPAASPAEEAAP